MSDDDIRGALDAYIEAAKKAHAASELHEQKRQEFQAAEAERAAARRAMFLSRSALDSLLEERAQ